MIKNNIKYIILFLLSIVSLIVLMPAKAATKYESEYFKVEDISITEENKMLIKINVLEGGPSHPTLHFTNMNTENYSGTLTRRYSLTEVTSDYVNPIYSQYEYYTVDSLTINNDGNMLFYIKSFENNTSVYNTDRFQVKILISDTLVFCECYYYLHNKWDVGFLGIGSHYDAIVDFSLYSKEYGYISVEQLNDIRLNLQYSDGQQEAIIIESSDIDEYTIEDYFENYYQPMSTATNTFTYLMTQDNIGKFEAIKTTKKGKTVYFSAIGEEDIARIPAEEKVKLKESYLSETDLNPDDIPDDIFFPYTITIQKTKLYDNKFSTSGDGFAVAQISFRTTENKIIFGTMSDEGYYVIRDGVSGDEIVLDSNMNPTNKIQINASGILIDAETGDPISYNEHNKGDANTDTNPGNWITSIGKTIGSVFGALGDKLGLFGNVITVLILIIIFVGFLKVIGFIINLFKKKE